MHNLMTSNGIVNMAYSGSTPWHGFGQKLPANATVQQAIDAARLDFTVSRRPLYLQDGRQASDAFMIVRDVPAGPAPMLGTVGSSFRPVQNTEAFALLHDACDKHGATIAAAGALGQGERVWMLAKMQEATSPIPGDTVNGYFLVANGHDGTLSFSARLTPIRVVCQNTLNSATNGSRSMITLRHTTNVQQRIGEARRLIDRMHQAMKATGETYANLAARRMNPTELQTFIESVFPPDEDKTISKTTQEKRRTVRALFESGAGADFAPLSAWNAYNAVTEYVDHVRPAESDNARVRTKAAVSAIFGSGDMLKIRALAEARKLLVLA